MEVDETFKKSCGSNAKTLQANLLTRQLKYEKILAACSKDF